MTLPARGCGTCAAGRARPAASRLLRFGLVPALLVGCAPREPDEPAGRVEGAALVEVAPGRHVEAVRGEARLVVASRRATLRGRLVSAPAATEAACVVEDTRGALRPLAGAPPGANSAAPVALPLGRGEWTLRCAGGARLEEPRLVSNEAAEGRLVALVVVDTLRDDFVDQATMPHTLAALARARRFTDVRANASWTLPSMASAMVSRPVLELTAPDGTLIGLPPESVTLAERLRRAGFATAAFVANGTLREGNGFAQGFSRFETTGDPGEPPPDASAVLAAARTWIAERSGEDAFVWIHLMEPHEPLRDHSGRGRTAVASRTLAGRERSPTPAEAATFRDLYRLEVAHADALLGPFLRGLPASAVVVLTADHGEMLGEGTVWGHGLTLYEPVLRVPLLLRAPGVEAGRDDAPGELLDLVPTLLARVGAEEDTGSLAGADLLSRRRRDRPRLAATFSAGPLRWSYRRGELAVLAHFAPQPRTGASAQATLNEVHGLPAGIWEYRPREEPVGAAGRPPTGEALGEVAASFARDVGALVPGYQVLVVEGAAGAELVLAVEGAAEPAAIHATAAASWVREGDRLRLSWPSPQPLALVSFGPATSVRPAGAGWRVGDRAPPSPTVPGLLLWRNPRAAVAQHPQAEILEHLRALGYLR